MHGQNSSPSSVCGFSDYGSEDEGRAGKGYKVSMLGLPETCSTSDVRQMLSDLGVDVKDVNFIGVSGTAAAIFTNTQKAADELTVTCHLRVLRGQLVQCRPSRQSISLGYRAKQVPNSMVAMAQLFRSMSPKGALRSP